MGSMATDTTSDRSADWDALARALPERLRVFVGPEDGLFVAHAVEFDIVGQGSTLDEALTDMFDLVRDYIRTAVELDEIDSIRRPMPRAEVARLWLKVAVSRAARVARHADRLLERTLTYDRPALQQKLHLA